MEEVMLKPSHVSYWKDAQLQIECFNFSFQACIHNLSFNETMCQVSEFTMIEFTIVLSLSTNTIVETSLGNAGQY